MGNTVETNPLDGWDVEANGVEIEDNTGAGQYPDNPTIAPDGVVPDLNGTGGVADATPSDTGLSGWDTPSTPELPTVETPSSAVAVDNTDEVGHFETFVRAIADTGMNIVDGVYNMVNTMNTNKIAGVVSLAHTVGLLDDEDNAKTKALITSIKDNTEGIQIANAIKKVGFEPMFTKKGNAQVLEQSDKEVAKFIGTVVPYFAIPVGGATSISGIALSGGAIAGIEELGKDNDMGDAAIIGASATVLGGVVGVAGKLGVSAVKDMKGAHTVNRVEKALKDSAIKSSADGVSTLKEFEKVAQTLGYGKFSKIPQFNRVLIYAGKSDLGHTFLKQLVASKEATNLMDKALNAQSSTIKATVEGIDSLTGTVVKGESARDVEGSLSNKLIQMVHNDTSSQTNAMYKAIKAKTPDEINEILHTASRGIDVGTLASKVNSMQGNILPEVKTDYLVNSLTRRLDEVAEEGNTFAGQYPEVHKAVIDSLGEIINPIKTDEVVKNLTPARFTELFAKVRDKLTASAQDKGTNAEALTRSRDAIEDFINEMTGNKLGSSLRAMDDSVALLHNVYNNKGISALTDMSMLLDEKAMANVLGKIGVMKDPKQYKAFMGTLEPKTRTSIELATIKNAMLHNIDALGDIQPKKVATQLGSLTFKPVTKEGKALYNYTQAMRKVITPLSSAKAFHLQDEYQSPLQRQYRQAVTGWAYRAVQHLLPERSLINNPELIDSVAEKFTKQFANSGKLGELGKSMGVGVEETYVSNILVNSINKSIHILEPFKDDLDRLPSAVVDDIIATGGENIGKMQMTPSIRGLAEDTQDKIFTAYQQTNIEKGITQYNVNKAKSSGKAIYTDVYRGAAGNGDTIIHSTIRSNIPENLIKEPTQLAPNIVRLQDSIEEKVSSFMGDSLKDIISKGISYNGVADTRRTIGMLERFKDYPMKVRFDLNKADKMYINTSAHFVIPIDKDGIVIGGKINKSNLTRAINDRLTRELNALSEALSGKPVKPISFREQSPM